MTSRPHAPPHPHWTRRQWLARAALAPLPALAPGAVLAAPPPGTVAPPPGAPMCIAPAKAGGGFELTCRLATAALQALPTGPALHTRFLPGGIGAVAFDQAVRGQLPQTDALVAFSSGSLLNLAQGRFGPHTLASVRWLCTLGSDHGVVAVPATSRLRDLAALLAALRSQPAAWVFGAGGTLGSQDWCKAALLLRAAGQDHRQMRFVSFEGGGEATRALAGGHVDVFTGDVTEARRALAQGAPLRVLAVLAPQRLGGDAAAWPTAREQAVDLTWPTVRGLYMAPQVPDEVFTRWQSALRAAVQAPGYAALCRAHGLEPLALVGEALQAYLGTEMERYQALMQTLGLRRWSRP